METNSPNNCSDTVIVRRNPHRKARLTPATVPISSSSSHVQDIPSFPIEDMHAMEDHINAQQGFCEPASSSLTAASSPVEASKDAENLKVFLRIRPLPPLLASRKHVRDESQTGRTRTKNAWPQRHATKKNTSTLRKNISENCITVNDTQSVILQPPSTLKDQKRMKSEVYEGFAHVFNAGSTQDEVYERMMSSLVEDFLKGKSGMLAALGPTGSGKTHTVFGSGRHPGMVPLALRRIYNDGDTSKSPRSFYISMFEISSERGKGERAFDLTPDGGDLCIQQSTTIKGLQKVFISDAAQAESLIARGMLKRATAMTNANSQSSRSQCIINIHHAPDMNDGEFGNNAVLTIVDLAGAEREKKTGNQGSRLFESNFINNTSMVFGLCLRSMLEHQKNPKKPMQKHFQNSLVIVVFTLFSSFYLFGDSKPLRSY